MAETKKKVAPPDTTGRIKRDAETEAAKAKMPTPKNSTAKELRIAVNELKAIRKPLKMPNAQASKTKSDAELIAYQKKLVSNIKRLLAATKESISNFTLADLRRDETSAATSSLSKTVAAAEGVLAPGEPTKGKKPTPKDKARDQRIQDKLTQTSNVKKANAKRAKIDESSKELEAKVQALTKKVFGDTPSTVEKAVVEASQILGGVTRFVLKEASKRTGLDDAVKFVVENADEASQDVGLITRRILSMPKFERAAENLASKKLSGEPTSPANLLRYSTVAVSPSTGRVKSAAMPAAKKPAVKTAAAKKPADKPAKPTKRPAKPADKKPAQTQSQRDRDLPGNAKTPAKPADKPANAQKGGIGYRIAKSLGDKRTEAQMVRDRKEGEKDEREMNFRKGGPVKKKPVKKKSVKYKRPGFLNPTKKSKR